MSPVPFPILRLRLSPVSAFPLDSECDRHGLMPLIGSSTLFADGTRPAAVDYAVSIGALVDSRMSVPRWRDCDTDGLNDAGASPAWASGRELSMSVAYQSRRGRPAVLLYASGSRGTASRDHDDIRPHHPVASEGIAAMRSPRICAVDLDFLTATMQT
jgi:hypothetical protein